MRESYGTGYVQRAQIKRRYDGANLFHLDGDITRAAG